MSYMVRIVGPAGEERFLRRGCAVRCALATVYSSQSAARKAMEAYRYEPLWEPMKPPYTEVIDMRPPERKIP